MGRPIKKQYMGPYLPNTLPQPQGQLIQGYAWFPDLDGPALAFMDKQVGPNTYVWRNQDDSTMLSGPCQLVNGGPEGPGQSNVSVTPYGYTPGAGAWAVVSEVSIANVTVDNPGTNNYLGGQTYAVTGGYYSSEGAITVDTFTGSNFVCTNGGNSYTIGTVLHLNIGNTGNTTVASITVNNVSNGSISSFTVTNSGVSAGTDTNSPATASTVSGTGNGAVFTFNTIINSVSINTGGSYTNPTNNPTFLFPSDGASVNVAAWSINTIAIASGGSGYDTNNPPQVNITPLNAFGENLSANVSITGDAVTGINLTGTNQFNLGQNAFNADHIGWPREFPAITIHPAAQAQANVTSAGIADVILTSGGNGYTLGDTLTIVEGTSTSRATIYVQSVTIEGTVDGFEVITYGVYTELPNSFTVTGGTGTGFTGTVWYKVIRSSDITVWNPAPGLYTLQNGPGVYITPAGPTTGPEGAVMFPQGSNEMGIIAVAPYGPEGSDGYYYPDARITVQISPSYSIDTPQQAQKIAQPTVTTWDDMVYSWTLHPNTLDGPTWAWLDTGYQSL